MVGDRLLTFLLLQNTHASETRFLGLPLAVVVLGPACVSMLKDLYRASDVVMLVSRYFCRGWKG